MSKTHLTAIYEAEVRSALSYLEYSDKKIQSLPLDPKDLNAETLETWESYLARFARVTDIFLTKYIRSYILNLDPAFRGELRDFVDKAEKNNLIDSSDKWMEIRELRNKISHEYSNKELKAIFESVKKYTPFVIAQIRKKFP